jgi:signal transduction histidine kinase
MKKLLARLGSPDAISWVNFAVIFVLQMAGSTISSLVDFSGRSVEFYSIRVFVLLCLIPVFILGHLALVRFAKTKPKPLITLATFLVAMFVTSFLFDYLLIVFDFTDQAQGFRRLSTVAFGFLSSSVLSSLLVSYAREFARDNQKLVASAKSLIETRAQASQRIADRKQALLESIKAQIFSALSKVQGRSAAEDTLQMRALIDDVVRPISYDLARNVEADSAKSQIEIEPKVDWFKVNSHALRANPFHWLASTAALSIIIAPFLVTTFQFSGALAVLGFAVTFSLLSLLAKNQWSRIPLAWSVPARVALFSFANAVIAVAISPLISLISGFDLLESSRMVAWVILCNLIAWTVALVIGAIKLLETNKQALTDSVDELKREVIALNGSYRQLQQGISRALHGPVQEAITVALLKLESNTSSKTQASLAEDLRHRIAKSLEVLDAPTQIATDVRKALEDLKELWSDAVDITFNVDLEQLTLLHLHPWSSRVLGELAREACSNAIRHGNATKISIEIETSRDTNSACLRVENNGEAIPENPRYGLGSQLFDEVCLEWSREQLGKERVAVVARVPLVEAVTSFE